METYPEQDSQWGEESIYGQLKDMLPIMLPCMGEVMLVLVYIRSLMRVTVAGEVADTEMVMEKHMPTYLMKEARVTLTFLNILLLQQPTVETGPEIREWEEYTMMFTGTLLKEGFQILELVYILEVMA